jgi:hypothetical protein
MHFVLCYAGGGGQHWSRADYNYDQQEKSEWATLFVDVKTQFKISHESDGLVLESVKQPSIVETALSCAGSLLFWGLVAIQFTSWPIAGIIAALGGWSGYSFSRRIQGAELRATNLEFFTSQRLWMFGPNFSIPRAIFAFWNTAPAQVRANDFPVCTQS